MRGLIKRLSIIISVCIITLFAICLTKNNGGNNSIDAPVRDVNVVDTSVSLDSIFYSYNIETNDNVITLEAQKLITREDFDNINNLSEVSVGNDNFIDFDIVYDAETNIISITASMDNELGYLEAETIYGVAFTNENGNIDAVLDCDGEMILLSDLGSVSSIEECKWFKKLCKTVKSVAKDVVETVVDVAVDTAAVVVAAAPAIATAAVVTAVVVAAAPAIIIVGEVAVAGASVGLATGLAAGAVAAATSIYSGYTEAVFAYANEIKEDLHEDIDDLFDGEATSSSCPQMPDDVTSDDDSFIYDSIKSVMGLYNLDITKIKSLLDEFIKASKKYEDNKTVYLGAGKDNFKNLASELKGMWFGVSDSRWEELVQEYTHEGMWLINKAYLNYVISKKWEIVLLSNPDEYYDRISGNILVEKSYYAKELQYLNQRGADWHYEGPYWRVDKAW